MSQNKCGSDIYEKIEKQLALFSCVYSVNMVICKKSKTSIKKKVQLTFFIRYCFNANPAKQILIKSIKQ